MPARLKVEFDQTIRGRLAEQFGYNNRFQIPVLDKVVINMGIGEGVADRKKVEVAANDLALISGQKAIITKARKSIATYKLRDGQAIGCKVTLRKARMYEFLDRLINIALPRVRDFRGLNPKSFDGRGNYTLGIKEHIVFPGNRLRQDRRSVGHGHHRLHHRGATTTRRGLCWPHLISRSGSEAEKASNAELRGALDGEEEFDRKEQPASPDDQKVFGPTRSGSRRSRATRPSRSRIVSPRR